MKRFPIDFSDTLGIEIEFNGVSYNELNLIMNELKNKNIISKSWMLEKEPSVIDGLEIKSPIMDRKLSWIKELKIICDMLKESDAKIDDMCGLHFHFGSQILKGSAYNFQNMILLWCHYEKYFIEKTKGNNKIRRSLWSYARPLTYSLSLKEKELLIKDYSSLNEFLKDFKKDSFSKIYSLNFQNINCKDKDTIEIRCPASTFNEDTIFEYISIFKSFFNEASNLNNIDRLKLFKELKDIPNLERNYTELDDYKRMYKQDKRKVKCMNLH